VCCGFLSPLKIQRLGWVLNPQTLVPVASTLTTTPPRRQANDIMVNNEKLIIKIWTEVMDVLSWNFSREAEKSREALSQNGQSAGRDLYLGPLEYEACHEFGGFGTCGRC
jgi:hypothetical protein